MIHIYIEHNHTRPSPFWTSIVQLDSLGSCSVTYTPGSTSIVKFWTDIWCGTCAMASQFPQLYLKCVNQDILLTDVLNSQGHNVVFNDVLDGVELSEWNNLLFLLSQISFTHSVDQLAWRWDTTGLFSVKSLYKFLNHRGIVHAHAMLWWNLPLPPKIRIFMWLTFHNRILSKVNLRQRGWEGDTTCPFCTQEETVKHLFLQCPVAKQLWFWLGCNQLYYTNWNTFQEVLEFALSLPKHSQTAFLIIFSAVCWTLWKHRNEICFQQYPPKQPKSILYLIISLLLYWSGGKKTKPAVQEEAHKWIPDEDILDAVPLRMILPGDEESISYYPDDSDSHN